MSTLIVPAPRNAQEAALQARVNERAAVLFTAGGYSWERETAPKAGPFYRVRSPEGKTYLVDPLLGFKCECLFYAGNRYCKHALAVAQVDAEFTEPDLPDQWDAIACIADRAEREVREAGFEEFDR